LKTFLRKQAVGQRYGIDVRSVDRWAADGRLPSPVYRGRIPLWDQDELEARDRQAACEREGFKIDGRLNEQTHPIT
jgi:predicted DNA-binding transcriptional regulator AlpA